jgi:hypothetical protein
MRDGFTIQERMCPWCWNRLTVRMGSGLSLCFNCRHHWRGASPLERHGPAQPDSEPFARLLFGAREAERLAVYRAAVQSGYYTDWPVKRVA